MLFKKRTNYLKIPALIGIIVSTIILIIFIAVKESWFNLTSPPHFWQVYTEIKRNYVEPISDSLLISAALKEMTKANQKNQDYQSLELSIIKGMISTLNDPYTCLVKINLSKEDRKKIAVESKMIENIAYFKIYEFTISSDQEFKKQFNKISKQNPRGIILDLRNNAGGFLLPLKKIAQLWLTDSEIIYIKYSHNPNHCDTVLSKSSHKTINLPTVILVNCRTASAAEILTAALHDNQRAIIIGQTTFGKGCCQINKFLSLDYCLRITYAYWRRPNGQEVHHIGIKPDIYEADSTLEKAIEILKIQGRN